MLSLSLSPISTRVLYAFALGDIYLSELDIFNLMKNVENVQGVYLSMWNMDSLLEDKCFSNVNTFSEVHFPIP